MRCSLPAAVAYMLAVLGLSTASGQTATYQPLGRWVDPQTDAFLRWDVARRVQATPAANPASRPQLAGLRPNHYELLVDGLQRKSTKISNQSLARKHILRLATSRAGTNVLNGAMAEAIFADRNPGWSYVGKANASQHDFTQPRPGGGRNNVQVKFHEDGDARTYMTDMKKDWSATKFAVPDDHVAALKSRLQAEYQRCKAAGDVEAAKQAARNIGRLRGIGADCQEIIKARNRSTAFAARQEYSTYVSLGASLVLVVGPTLWDWGRGNIADHTVVYRTTRALSLLGVGVGTDTLLVTVKHGALRGTLRGNVIVGTALMITEVTWLLYEHGWQRAFYQPEFYEQVVGGMSGIALGVAGGSLAAVATSEMGPWVAAPVGIVTGVVAGTVGYIGGRSATHVVLDILAPDLIQQYEREQLNTVTAGIEQTIAAARDWPAR